MSFKRYLTKLNLATSTIERYLSFEKEFILFFSIENKSPKNLSYNDLLRYFNYKQKSQVKRSTLVHLLSRIQHYYDYLGVENPLEDFKLKGYENPNKPSCLTAGQLKKIALVYHENKRLSLLSKVAIGLLVYQGLATHELALLKPYHIDLQRAEINVPKSHLNERALSLEAVQILDLIQLTHNKSPSSKLLDYQGPRQLQNRHTHWKAQIKRELAKHKLNIPFTNLQQLRASRIALWIKDLGILHAQYLAGHQQLSSTQKYQAENYEQMRATFEQIHPLF